MTRSKNGLFVVQTTGALLEPPSVTAYGPTTQKIAENVLERIAAGQTSSKKEIRPYIKGEKTFPVSLDAVPAHLR